MTNRITFSLALLALTQLATFSFRSYGQGALIPSGPPRPLMKTLDQIEPRQPIGSLPFAITNSGVYYLTGSISGIPGQNGITVSADNVLIDLNGFTLNGPENALAAIKVNGAQRVTIQNGAVVGWSAGIAAAASDNGVFQNLNFSSVDGRALESGSHATISQCRAVGGGSDGIKTGASSSITDCSAVQNSGSGIVIGISSVIARCNVISNSVYGIIGGHFGIVENCHAFSNGSAGAAGLDGCRYTGCTFGANYAGGLAAGNNTQVENCAGLNNLGVGILVGNLSQIENTKASGNSTSGFWSGSDCYMRNLSAANNGDNGIATTDNAHVSDCKSSGNGTTGFRLSNGSTIQNCSAQHNSADGILVTSECTVSGNSSNGNFNARDAAGIHATGTDNCVKDNNVVSNDRGLSAENSGNAFLRNTVSNNSLNYALSDEQVMAPTLTKDSIKDPANPWSNLTF